MAYVLRNINFGNIFNVSGARNFFPAGIIGNGWRQHEPLKLIPGYSWEGSTFISKTTTLEPRLGNLDLRSDLQSRKFMADCVYVDWLKAIALNDVSLSGPGAAQLLNYYVWQQQTEPLLISFMAVAETAEDRIDETINFCAKIKAQSRFFRTKFGLEINDFCPNTGHDPRLQIIEAPEKLKIARTILPDVPITWKINALTSPEDAKKITDTGLCDGLAVSNTIPWLQNAAWTNKSGTRIDWQGLFGTDISPLKKRGYGNGGLSGWPLLNLVVEWVATARDIGITIPIKAEGGIQKREDIQRLAAVGANAIGLGCVSFLRPWRLKGLIDYGNMVIT